MVSTPSSPFIAFYTILLVITSITIIKTASTYPLFPFQTSSLQWNNAWLVATVIDYYGSCFSLCGIILVSEEKRLYGSLWCCGCCLLGSPVCCIWMLVRLYKYGSGGICLQNGIQGSSNAAADDSIVTESSHLS